MLNLPIPTDPVGFRWFIMHDVYLEKPILEGYKDMCKKIDPDFEYLEYEYWYHRFLAGDLNVNYDRSDDPKPRKLEELPEDVLGKILEPLNVKQRSTLREVSKSLLAVVDELKTVYEEISIRCFENTVRISVKSGDFSWIKIWSEEVDGENYMEIALRYLEIIMKPTKIRVENFEIGVHDLNHSKQIVELWVSIFKTKNLKFQVKSAKIRIPKSLALSFLSIMKPGFLENLTIECAWGEDENALIDISQLKDTEHFKKAKTVDLIGLGYMQSRDLVLFSNFEKFVVGVQSMGLEDVTRLRDDLSKPDSIFKKCEIYLLASLENSAEYARLLGNDYPKERNYYVKQSCAIANSRKFLHFDIGSEAIRVEKGDQTPPDDMYEYGEDYDDDSEFDDDSQLW